MTTANEVKVVDVGQSIEWPAGGEAVVMPRCDSDRGTGAWGCVTHQETFRNNLQASGHEMAGSHLVAWICFEHGPEVP